jgi:hypothetical protein
MTLRLSLRGPSILSIVAALLAASCSSQQSVVQPTTPSSLTANLTTFSANLDADPLALGASSGIPTPKQLKVCKLGNESGTFNIVKVSGTASIAGLGHIVTNGTCQVVAETAASATISVTETPSTGLQFLFAESAPGVDVPFSNGGSLTIDTTHGYTTFFANATSSSMACGHGYWKQDFHFDSWSSTGFTPGTLVSAAFGISADSVTLLDALELKGKTSSNGIAHQAVAALLNAAKGFGYPLTVGSLASPGPNTVRGLIQRVNSGLLPQEDVTALLDAFNSNLPCPLN